MSKVILYSGIACLVIAGLYALVLAPRVTIRFPADWSFEAEYLGELAYIDHTQEVPGKPMVNMYTRSMRVVEWNRHRAVIEESTVTRDAHTGETTWATTVRFTIDPSTGAILSYPGDHTGATKAKYGFPRNTQKTTYPLFNFTLWPIILEFTREDSLSGVDVYVFRYKGMVDFTELTRMAEYAGGMGGFPAEVRVQSFDYYTELWVEPRSGEIVHIAEIDPGDYWVDAKTGKTMHLVSIWSGSTTGNSDRKLIERVKSILFLLDLHNRWLPGILLGTGLLFLAGHALLAYRGYNKRAARLLHVNS